LQIPHSCRGSFLHQRPWHCELKKQALPSGTSPAGKSHAAGTCASHESERSASAHEAIVAAVSWVPFTVSRCLQRTIVEKWHVDWSPQPQSKNFA
jgi:hypothetical protein